jgi:hypothetical protein
MNAEADTYVQACKQESLKHGSAAAARLHALQNLKLKTAIKVLMKLRVGDHMHWLVRLRICVVRHVLMMQHDNVPAIHNVTSFSADRRATAHPCINWSSMLSTSAAPI